MLAREIVRISDTHCIHNLILHRRGNGGYGKRATETDAELDSVTRKIVDLFQRASQMDEEQCVSRLICEVNAGPENPKSVRISNKQIGI